MKLVFMQHSRIFLTSGFELIVIVIAWFIPIVLAKNVNFITDANNQALVLSCLESVVFLLAMKVIIRKEPSKNMVLVSCLVCAYFLIGLGSLLKL